MSDQVETRAGGDALRGELRLEPGDAARAIALHPQNRLARVLAGVFLFVGGATVLIALGGPPPVMWGPSLFFLGMGAVMALAASGSAAGRRVRGLSDDQRSIRYRVERDSLNIEDGAGSVSRLAFRSVRSAVFSTEVITLMPEKAIALPIYLRAFSAEDRVAVGQWIDAGIPAEAKRTRRS